MPTKEFWKSKTFWFNLILLIVAVAGELGFAGYAPDAKFTEILGLVAAVVNLIMRYTVHSQISVLGHKWR